MAEDFLTFKSFNDESEAGDLFKRLVEKNIPYQLEDTDTFFNPGFVRNQAQRELNIKIRSADFIKAQNELDEFYTAGLDKIDPSYICLLSQTMNS